MREKNEDEIKGEIRHYLAEHVIEKKGTWRDYEKHKKQLDRICQGNPVLYDFAIGCLVEKLSI